MKATAVIPAFNEAERVGSVLEALQTGLVGQTVVVDDGSTDDTAQVARNYGVQVLSHETNKGKVKALASGVRQAKYETLLFLDADLIGLRTSHVEDMLSTYWDKDLDMVIGVFRKGRLNTDISQKLNPHLSGQRVLNMQLWSRVMSMEVEEFGVEMALTNLARTHNLRSEKVPLEGVSHVMKEEKRGLGEGLKSRLSMYGDIVKATFNRPWFRSN